MGAHRPAADAERVGPAIGGGLLRHVERVHVERGTIVWLDLPRNVTMLLELERAEDSEPVLPWRSVLSTERSNPKRPLT